MKDSSCAVFGSYYQRGGAIEALSAGETHERLAASRRALDAGERRPRTRTSFSTASAASHAPRAATAASGGSTKRATVSTKDSSPTRRTECGPTHKSSSLPSGALSAGKNGGVVALACPAVGNCRASGAYLDASNHYQAVVVTETNGVWATGVKVVLPGQRDLGRRGRGHLLADLRQPLVVPGHRQLSRGWLHLRGFHAGYVIPTPHQATIKFWPRFQGFIY